jgi:hypothetical protein
VGFSHHQTPQGRGLKTALTIYVCPAGKILTTTRKVVNDDPFLYRAGKRDCDVCRLKMQCCPKVSFLIFVLFTPFRGRRIATRLLDEIEQHLAGSCIARTRISIRSPKIKSFIRHAAPIDSQQFTRGPELPIRDDVSGRPSGRGIQWAGWQSKQLTRIA